MGDGFWFQMAWLRDCGSWAMACRVSDGLGMALCGLCSAEVSVEEIWRPRELGAEVMAVLEAGVTLGFEVLSFRFCSLKSYALLGTD